MIETRWRCENKSCSFYKARKKKNPKFSEERCKWSIATGSVDRKTLGDNVVVLRCPHCDYQMPLQYEKLDEPKESIVESFKKLRKDAS